MKKSRLFAFLFFAFLACIIFQSKTYDIEAISDKGCGGKEKVGSITISDSGLRKADDLKENEFVVDGTKGRIGENKDDYVYYFHKTDPSSNKSVVCIEFCKEHPVYYSTAGGSIHVTPDQVGKEIDMLTDKTGMTWMSLFSLKDPNQGYSDTNKEVSFNSDAKDNLAKATCKVSKNESGGGYTALAYFKTKDGKEAYCKMNAKVEAPW